MTKRCFDVAAACFALCLFAPVLLMVAVLVYLEDRGRVLFLQDRVGRDRVSIRVYKFRTMHDGVVTRVGHWLRATGIDEMREPRMVRSRPPGAVWPPPQPDRPTHATPR